ncbi:MAG: hypothetical protein HYV38_03425 [Candidatus Levybacteria bacterium]|nr:hypothetical protein [Candidatus Levybacteria bacterium]
MAEDKYERVERSKKEIMVNNFLGGIMWGIGVTLGLALLFGILGILVSRVDFVPIVGNFISSVIQFVINQNTVIK